mgnify:CR=1 FL=1
MEEKRCVLCNKTYNYKYMMFGRGCLDNLYGLLKFSKPPRFIWNKESYLCTQIAWKNHKFFLNKKKKYALAQKYIALNYLNKMNYDFLDDIKAKISKDIKGISVFSRNIVDTISFSLNDIYKLYNYSQKFDKIITELKSVNWEEVDKKVAENFIKSMSFIFDVSEKINPISYAVFYSMQYIFWQVVVIGGIITEKPLSAKLLSNSLTLLGKEPEDLIIEDKVTEKLLMESIAFNDKIKELTEKYGKETGKFDLKDYEKEGVSLRFEGGDLLYALHKATMFVKAIKNEDGTWRLEGEINDTYDFTEFKDLKEYADNKEAILTDIFSTLLNNFGVASSEYGVIKTYEVKIKFNFSNYEIE